MHVLRPASRGQSVKHIRRSPPAHVTTITCISAVAQIKIRQNVLKITLSKSRLCLNADLLLQSTVIFF